MGSYEVIFAMNYSPARRPHKPLYFTTPGNHTAGGERNLQSV